MFRYTEPSTEESFAENPSLVLLTWAGAVTMIKGCLSTVYIDPTHGPTVVFDFNFRDHNLERCIVLNMTSDIDKVLRVEELIKLAHELASQSN